VRYAFTGGCVSTQAVLVDSVLASVLEDVALPSLLIANHVSPRFVFPPSPTFSSDPLFSATIPLSRTTKDAEEEVSLRSEGSSSAPIGIGDGSVEHRIQSTSTRQISFSSGDFLWGR